MIQPGVKYGNTDTARLVVMAHHHHQRLCGLAMASKSAQKGYIPTRLLEFHATESLGTPLFSALSSLSSDGNGHQL